MTHGRPIKIVRYMLGFSLLELMVVIVLIGGLITLAVFSLRALQGLDVKNEITKIAALTSEVYGLAASGKTHRIIFDLDAKSYWVEEKIGEISEIRPELGYEGLMKSHIKKPKSEEEDEVLSDFIPRYKPIEGPLGKKMELAKGLVFYGAWTEQMEAVARTGQVAIYFFAGNTETAFVSLAGKDDEKDSAMYLALSPLTGSVTIDQGEPNTEDLLVVEKIVEQ
jgi:prepilin-type N-terminal cleavage/methylation domain-containing protein